ncbi:UNVERIFIED_CONTAM: hypothetical protein FKN15_064271 [Acipenser sinensis]
MVRVTVSSHSSPLSSPLLSSPLFSPAQFVGERSFQDRYFDTEQFTLTLSDTWLRCRGACWELKCPVRVREGEEEEEEEGRERGGGGGGGGEEGRNIKLCTRYREITELSEIVDRVRQVVLRERRGEGEREREILKEGGGQGERSCKTEAEKEGEGRGEREKEGEREGRGEREKEGEREGRGEREKEGESERRGEREKEGEREGRGEREKEGESERRGEREKEGEREGRGEREKEGERETDSAWLGLSEACKNRVPGKMDAYLKQFHPEHYGTLKKHRLPGDTSVMSYRGHGVLHTLIRCRFSPEFSTGQRYIYTGCSTGRVVALKKHRLPGDTSVMSYRGHGVLHTLIRCRFSPEFSTGQRYIYTGCSTGRCTMC